MDRRRFLASGLAGAATARLPFGARAADGGDACAAACMGRPDGRFAVALLDATGDILTSEILPGRGHGIAVSPDGVAAVWDAADGRYLARHAIGDVCGVAAARQGGVLLSDGLGRIWRNDDVLAAHAGVARDNHMTAIEA